MLEHTNSLTTYKRKIVDIRNKIRQSSERTTKIHFLLK